MSSNQDSDKDGSLVELYNFKKIDNVIYLVDPGYIKFNYKSQVVSLLQLQSKMNAALVQDMIYDEDDDVREHCIAYLSTSIDMFVDIYKYINSYDNAKRCDDINREDCDYEY